MESDRTSISELFDSKTWRAMIREPLTRVDKDNDLAEKIRKTGDIIFMGDTHDAYVHEQAWKMYSLSIAVAEKETETLAISYGNRSAILLHLGKCEPCLRDIDRALEISNSNPFKIEMLCRKMECMHALGSSNIQKVIIEAEALLDEVSEESIRKTYTDLLSETKFKLSTQSTLKVSKDGRLKTLEDINESHSLNDFSAVKIQYSEHYGRHLIAKKNFAPGEVIYMEKPYTMFLNMKKMHAYCSHCFSTTWANIPCDRCSWTMFCSEECKSEAWQQYHDLECPVYAYAKKNDHNDSSKQLAIRLFIMALREAGSLENLKAELEAFNGVKGHTTGFMENGRIKTQGFKTIYSLVDRVAPQSLKKHLEDTAMILKSIARNTTLFGEQFSPGSSKPFTKSEDALFIGALIFKLCRLSQLNKHQMWNGNYVCHNKLDRLSCWENQCCTRGSYIAPVTSLLNHSCDPNVRRCFTEDKKVILYAVRPIQKGSQLFDCYQQEYYELDTVPRQQILRETYNFDCNCNACQKKWPHLMTLMMFLQVRPKSQMPVAELQLVMKYNKLVQSTLKPGIRYSYKDITSLGEGIKKGLEMLPKPSFCTVNLIICLNTIFERLCGICLCVPSTCQKS